MKTILAIIKAHYKLILLITGIVILIIIVIPIIRENNIKNDLYKRYMNGTLFEKQNKTTDSLKLVVQLQKDIIIKNDIKLDSLYKAKSTKIITYETNIKNFANPNIISDDSITSYISKKLHN